MARHEDVEEAYVEDRKMILLEGNIGAGKSTVGSMLKTSGLFDFIEEPVDRWQTGFASNLLEAFYHDMARWSFTFQILAFITRAKTWQEVLARTNHSRVVLERSIFTDRHVFATSMHRIGAMSETEVSLEGRFRRSRGKIEALQIRTTYKFLEQPQQQESGASATTSRRAFMILILSILSRPA